MNENTVYNRQIAVLIFMISVVRKISSLPALMAEQLKSSTFIFMVFYCVLEIIAFIFIYLFIVGKGSEFLKNANKGVKIPLYLIMFILFGFKFLMLSTYAVNYVATVFFDTKDPVIIAVTMLPIIAFIAYRGITSIARTSEFLLLMVIIMLAFVFVFLDAEMNFSRLKPIFAGDLSTLLPKGLSFGLWFGDVTPLLLVLMRKHKRRYIAISLAVSYTFICVVIAIALAIFGNSLALTQSLFVEFVSLSQMVTLIGRVQWVSLIPMFIMMIIDLSLLFWGAAEACSGIIGNRKISIAIVFLLVTIPLIAISNYEIFFEASKGVLGYISFGLSFALPIVCFIILNILRRRNAKALEI